MARRKSPTPVPSSEARSEALRAQSKEALVGLLEELAARYPEVEARLDRLVVAGDSAQLAAGFRDRLQGWINSTHFLGRSGASGFGRELEHWLDEVERELLPIAPALAHRLADSFLRADRHFFEQADDSDGAIGDAVRAGCRLWLRCARAWTDPSADSWSERVYALVNADEYGARAELLAAADTLFDEAGSVRWQPGSRRILPRRCR